MGIVKTHFNKSYLEMHLLGPNKKAKFVQTSYPQTQIVPSAKQFIPLYTGYYTENPPHLISFLGRSNLNQDLTFLKSSSTRATHLKEMYLNMLGTYLHFAPQNHFLPLHTQLQYPIYIFLVHRTHNSTIYLTNSSQNQPFIFLLHI